jgi:hypothetical protein
MSDDDISLLIEFIERCGPDVEGHGLIGLRVEQSAMIERFIDGRCNDAERQELSRFLQLHPAWIRWIAERIKTGRDLDGTASAAGQ